MAGDWIKIEHVTPDKAEVIRLAQLLKIDQDAVLGKLVRIWIWADQNFTSEALKVQIPDAFIDRLAGCPGFAGAMRNVFWLQGGDGRLQIPNFTRHNGQSAKARAETNRRVSEHRMKKRQESDPEVKRECNESLLQKPLPEKRREEIRKQPNNPRARDLEAVLAFAAMDGCPPEEATRFWNHFESSGWVDKNGNPVVNVRSKLRTWTSAARAQPLEDAHKAKGDRPARAGGAEVIVRQKELEEVQKKIADILNSYEAHQTMTTLDAHRISELRKRRKELRAMLGYKA